LGYKRKSGTFRSFKSRFEEKLLNMLFFIEISKTRLSAVNKAEYECSKLQHQARMLGLLYGRRPAIKLAKKIFNIALKYQLSEFMVYSIGLLLKHASETGDKFAFQKYKRMQSYWLAQLTAEENAKTSMEGLNILFGKSIGQKPELTEVALKYMHGIKRDIRTNDGYVLQYNKRKIEAIAYQIGQNYQKSLLIWSGLENYLNKNPDFASDTKYAEIAVQQMDCYMHLQEYDKGKKCAETCQKYFWPGSSNRLIFMEFYFLLTIQSGEYEMANRILEEAIHDKYLQNMSVMHQKKWRLFKAYLIYVLEPKDQDHSFDTDEFLNEFLVFKMDKRGYNVALLILNWCMLLRNGDFTKLITITNALKEYRLRNLKGKPDQRVNLFVSMMQTAYRLDYDPNKLRESTNTFLRKIRDKRIVYSANMEGLEVIPFDVLWGMVINDMKVGNK